ncbi:hypothetical protein COF61_32410 [Bacillus toyonensis]|uniref:hypothetical protein n=1 Tax=Bacillus TaxID=1386 RepID=UPI000BFB5D25|nr:MULTISPECIES: hypothetical protein [Bacillus]MBY7110646.1 hypothetical protein [Bacillus sp. 17RED48]PHD52019.1 hypothetical protein COF61_32410 [Bacillus toyonensis]
MKPIVKTIKSIKKYRFDEHNFDLRNTIFGSVAKLSKRGLQQTNFVCSTYNELDQLLTIV